MEKDHQIYLGLVIQNNDVEMRGRIKVYIPQLAPNIKSLNTNVDKFFNFLGGDNPDLSVALDDLKNTLPWAEYAGPMAGGNASGRYNAYTDTGTTSDSNAWDGGKISEGFRPLQSFVGENAYPDAFSKTDLHKNKFVNQFSYQYTPSNYSGLARGLFTIPNVGSHVYIFFIGGDRNFPVYFASAYGQEDIKRIFTMAQDVSDSSSVDYPSSYENNSSSVDTALTAENKTFRSKLVLNSNKHTIEMIDTDLREILKFTHYSGSFKEFNNYATIELASKNDQKMVIGDQFLTVQKNKSEYIKHHNETIVGGDRYINIGETDSAIVKKIVDIHKTIHKYKLEFDTQRRPIFPITKPPVPALFKICPVCKGIPYNPFDTTMYSGTFWQEANSYIPEICTMIPFEEQCNPDLANPLIMFKPEPLDPAPMAGQLGVVGGAACDTCNGTGSVLIAHSPSTEDGLFPPTQAKLPGQELDKLILATSPLLFNLEKQLGNGGDEIKSITMNKIETIGTVMNDMQSYRIDPIGALKIDGCYVSPQLTYDTYKPTPHVQYVDVADIPGGDYILTVMNKYKLLVGARGINIETFGPVDIYGSIMNIAAEQLNISSNNEIVIDGGERFSIRAKKISLLPNDHNAVVVEGQLHVTRNVIIEGGLMLEGEVGLLHVIAPLEWQQTENALFELEPTCTIPVVYNIEEMSLTLPPHTHYFKNLPLSLYEHNERVRTEMIDMGINSREKIAAAQSSIAAGDCPDELYYAVEQEVSNAAMAKAEEKAAAKGVEGGIILTGSGRGLCITQANGNTLMTSFYKWTDAGRCQTTGIVTMKTIIDKDFNIISIKAT